MKKMNLNVKIFLSIILLLIVGTFISVFTGFGQGNSGFSSGKYDNFAQCLKGKGATFYGAFWCPHCQKQKKMFGSSAKFLPYIECSTPDGNEQTQICKDKKIEGYPTWEFADGTRLNGEISFEELANKTSCVLPTQ